nr:oligosaccharide flippase family protein [Allobranchiibius sp. GilTou38]
MELGAPAETSVRRASATVFIGSAAGFAVSLGLTPVISRLYSPADYGLFATITAVASVFVGVSTLRLEIIAQKVPDHAEGSSLLRLSLLASIVAGLLLTVVGIGISVLFKTSWWWALTGVLVLVASLQLVGSAALTREGQYRRLGIANFLQGAGLGVVQTAFGVARSGVSSLLFGFLAARAVWARPAFSSVRGSESRTVWKRHRATAAVAGSSALVNSLASQLVVLATSILFGHAAVGILAMGVRVLVSPLSLVSQAVATASVGQVGAILRRGDRGRARMTVLKGMRDQAILGTIPCALALVLGPILGPVVLGSKWDGVGGILAALSVGAWAQFAVSPFSQLMNLSGHSNKLLRWDVTRLAVVLASLAAPALLGSSITSAIWCYSAGQCLVYGLLAIELPGCMRSAANGPL